MVQSSEKHVAKGYPLTSVGFDTPVGAFPQPRGKKVDVAFFRKHAFHPSNT